ncbi:MAG TPA: gephyrin-like molybdotransferase Glp [Terriglobales bacterium]|jgi:molybdopterin molybdotransferase|nr:gephyrin-like molybdotransferase Glp [Terriglobales bacterium]
MSPAPPTAGVVSFEDAFHIVERQAAKVAVGQTESVDLLSALGRILAEPISADRDFPPFPRATRDGYAVRAADVATVPARLETVGEIKAGDSPKKSFEMQPGQTVSIMTGAPLPPGADAVVMVEYTAQSGNSVEVQRSVKTGENFVPRASEASQNQMLLDRGTRLDHAAVALAASVGRSSVQVFRKPRIAVLATGDEIVAIDKTPGPSQIRNSNTYSLAAQIQYAGGEAVLLPVAPDERVRLKALIEEGLQSDLLLMAGGVSMGKYDLVEQVLEELRAEFFFTGAQIQPGRPIVFGRCPENRTGVSGLHSKYFFGLPGNPVSTMVTFELFVRPMIRGLAGGKPQPLIFLKARLKSDVRTKTGLMRFLPAVLSGEFERAEVELARWQGSGDIAALAVANCYLVIPPDREHIPTGEWISVLMR